MTLIGSSTHFWPRVSLKESLPSEFRFTKPSTGVLNGDGSEASGAGFVAQAKARIPSGEHTKRFSYPPLTKRALRFLLLEWLKYHLLKIS